MNNDIFDILNYDFDEVSVTPDMLDQSLDQNEDISLGLNYSEVPLDGLIGDYSYAPEKLKTPMKERYPSDNLSYLALQNPLPTNYEQSLNSQFSNSCSVRSEGPSTSVSPISYNTISYNNFDGSLDSGGDSSSSLGVSGYGISENSGMGSFNNFCEENSNSPDLSNISSTQSSITTNVKRRTRTKLTELTDEEKYLRIREQNNIASREYRNRKKSKTVSVKNNLQDVTKENEQLKFLSNRLENYLHTCRKTKELLQSAGYDFSHLNLE